MLNTGSALWKPYQSFPNRLRCFLLANPGADLRYDMRRTLRAEISADTLQNARYTSDLRNLFSLFINDRYPLLEVQRDTYYTIKRQCRLCASKVFHSPLYDVPWLMTCPVHPGEPLVEVCPLCGRAWDQIVAGNRCCVCGTELSPDTLIRQGAYESEDVYAPLNLLTRMLTVAQTQTGWLCHTGRAVDGYASISACDWWHNLFPSLLAAMDDQYVPVFERWQVPLYPCRTLVTGCLIPTRRSNARARDRNRVADWKFSKEMTNHRIAEYTGRHCDCQLTPGGSTTRCPACLAYHLWKRWIGLDKSCYPIELLRRCFTRRYGRDFPPKPKPCSYLLFGSGCYAFPRKAQSLVYEGELWGTYWSFLTRIQNPCQTPPARFVSLRPAHIHPAPLPEAPGFVLGINRTKGGGLVLTIPLWFIGVGDPLPNSLANDRPGGKLLDVEQLVRQLGEQQRLGFTHGISAPLVAG